MLDADSLFERLLREAANLVPKMSTPKLTNALKVTSSLQQKITDTVASRLPQEKTTEQINDTLRQQLSIEAVMSQGGLLESTIVSDSNDYIRRATLNQWDGNYSGITLFPQLNHLGNATSKDLSDSIATSELSTFTYPAGTLFSPMNTMTAVMSSGTGMGGCGTLLVPLVTGNHGILHPNTSNSSQLSVIPDSSVIMTAGNVPSTVNFLHPTNASAIQNANFKSEMKNESVNSNHNGQIQCIKESIELKPEPPLDCFGLNSSRSTSNSNDLNSVEFSQLAPITHSFGSGFVVSPHSTPVVTTSISNAILRPVLGHHLSASASDSLMMVANPTSVNSHNLTTTTGGTHTSTSTSSVLATTTTSKSNAGNGPYRCRECDKEFRILRYLEKHRRIHTGEKPYQCCYCGRQFNDWPNMNRHKRIHTGERPYRCTVCTKTFSQPAVYNEHVKRHTGERPYICTVCAKGFPRAARLAVHMRVHTGERPYPCTSCDRRFSQPHHLAAHLRVHSGDRPYSCPKCDVSFACISNLRRHRKQVHPSSPIPSDQSDGKDYSKNLMDDKKPSLQCLAAATVGVSHCGGGIGPISSSTVVSSSAGALTLDASSFMANSSTLSSDNQVAIAAAMSGTMLTATGALVPANFLPASSIPGLILTSGAAGALIATGPHHLTDQSSHLHPALIARNSGNLVSIGQSLSAGTHVVSSTPTMQSEAFLKANSSTMSLMFPTVLTSSANVHGGGSVAFLTSSGELDRSCTATLATTGPDGSLVVNPVDGETVYLEQLDPRLALESGHQFTLTTIPSSHHQSVSGATIFHPHHSAHTAQLLGHSVQIQSAGGNGPHTTHLAFASPQASHMLTHNSGTLFQTNNTSPGAGQTQIHASQSPATLIFPSQNTLPQSQQQSSVLQQTSIESGATPSQLLHYHHQPQLHHHQQQHQQQHLHPQRSISNINILPSRPASTPTQQLQVQQQQQQQQQQHHQQQQQQQQHQQQQQQQHQLQQHQQHQQQTAMLVPIVHTPPVTGTQSSTPTSDQLDLQLTSIQATSNPNWAVNSGTFVTLTSSHLCPVSSSITVPVTTDDQMNCGNMLTTCLSRPSSVLSNSSSIGGGCGGVPNFSGSGTTITSNLDTNL